MDEQSPLRLQQRRYWRKTMALTVLLLLAWFVVTFVTSYYSAALNAYTFMELPLGYFIAAQGSLVVYLVLIGVYALLMNRLDRQFGVDEQ